MKGSLNKDLTSKGKLPSLAYFKVGLSVSLVLQLSLSTALRVHYLKNQSKIRRFSLI
jgi:hypothetical protein